MLTLAAFALLASTPFNDLTAWLDRIAQSQLDARQPQIDAVHDRASAQARSAEARTRILRSLGGFIPYDGPLNARTTGTLEESGYRIEKIVFESLPRYFVTGNLYLPDSPGRHPAVLVPMGHWDEGKTAAQQIAGNLALKGFVVFAFDPVGQGERLQAYDWRVGSSLGGGATEQHIQSGALALLEGKSFARYRLHDTRRALDYLAGRAEVDPDRLGATGCSGGGTLTTYIAALDPRIKVAVSSCYMNSYRLLFAGPVGDSEQSLPNFLSAGLDQTDFVELFAPKPWLITSTEQDFFTPAGAKIVYDEARRWYTILGAEDRIKWVIGPGGHGTPPVVREAVYDWFLRWLGPGRPGADAKEQPIHLHPDHELRVSETGQVSTDFDSRELYEIIRDELPSIPNSSDISASMRTLIGHHAPSAIHRTGDLISFEPDPGLQITARLLPAATAGRHPAVLLVQSDLEASEHATQLAAAGNTVLLLAPRGLPAPATIRFSGDWITNARALLVGRVLPAMRAHDILCGIDLLAEMPEVDPTQIRATAADTAGIWLLMAAAADSRIQSIELSRTPYSLRAAFNNPLNRGLYDAVVPGAVAAWDLVDLVKAIAPRQVTWTDPVDWMRNLAVLPGYRYSTFGN